jgi:hypothetical protein
LESNQVSAGKSKTRLRFKMAAYPADRVFISPSAGAAQLTLLAQLYAHPRNLDGGEIAWLGAAARAK